MSKIKGPPFRGNGPKKNGYAHTSTSERSPRADRVRRLKEREAAKKSSGKVPQGA